MSAVKKYAGLPDLDLGTEIFETAVPELTEASTIPTDADGFSDDGNRNPDYLRQKLDPKAARQKFEPYEIDARNVNFSDTIDGGRRDYQIRSKRRRRRAALAREQQDEYTSDESDEETVQGRLARLKREVAELQAEIEKIDHKKEKSKEEDEDSDYEDTVDRFHDTLDLMKGAEELRSQLECVTTLHRKQKGITLEEEFIQKLQVGDSKTQSRESTKQDGMTPSTTLSEIAVFSDRLTLLETALGVTPLSQPQASSPPIIPTLTTLTTQIETLHSVLTHFQDGHVQTYNGPVPLLTTAHLDPIAEKIRFLISESKRLEDSRKAATISFEELLETRDRHAHLFQTHNTTHSNAEARLSRQNINGDHPDQPGKDRNHQTRSSISEQFTPLFLDSQASKISALYNVLPTIQSLQPLLPVVLERLRALSIIHAATADVKADMDEFENRLSAQEEDIVTWEEALEDAEKAMQENKVIMKENVEVVGGKVKGLEDRVRSLGSKK